MVRNTDLLDEHMRRTDLLERYTHGEFKKVSTQMEHALKPINTWERFISFMVGVKGLAKWIAAIVTGVTAIGVAVAWLSGVIKF
jgi:hypothetical protein